MRQTTMATAALVWILAVASVSGQTSSATQAAAAPRVAVAATSSYSSGEQIYREACITCHATDGKGSPRTVVGFDTPLPDFSDCGFATAEPDPDWQAVVSRGGTIRGLSRRMPAFGEVLTADEIAMVVTYLRGFCEEPAWPRGDLNFPRAFFTEKAFPENEAVWTTTFTGGDAGSVGNAIVYEKRIGARNQVELVVPIDFLKNGQSGWTRGLGDVAVAFKRAIYVNADRGSIAAAGAEVGIPTGKESLGLGGGTAIYEPFVMWGQALPRNSFVQIHSALELPSDTTKATREAFVRTAVGTTFAQDAGFGRAWSPQVEVIAARPFGGRIEWDVVPQMQVTLSKIQHVMVAAAVRVPLNERSERRTQFMTYLLWDWFDGGFFDFWK